MGDGEGWQHVGEEVDQEELAGAERGAAGQRGAQDGEGDFASVAAEEDGDRVADAGPQGAPFVEGVEDAGEVGVGEDQVGGGAGGSGSVGGQADADVGEADGGGVVAAIAGHGDDAPGLAQGLDDTDFVFGGYAHEHACPVDGGGAFRGGQGVEFKAGEDVMARTRRPWPASWRISWRAAWKRWPLSGTTAPAAA